MPFLGLMTVKEAQAAIKEAIVGTLPKWLLETAEAEQFNLPDPSVYGNQATLYQKLSWVLTAVDMTAQAAALTPFSVARLVAGKEPKDIPNHDFELLLNRPNPMDSRFEFLYATVAYWKLNGNAYWFVNTENETSSLEPYKDELWVIPPSMIIPVPDGKSFLRGYLYYPGNGREIFLEPWQIVHFKRFNPFSRFVGLSAVESIAFVAAGDLGMQKWNTELFAKNNARLPGILLFEQMVADGTWAKIKEDTREAAANREMLMLRGTGEGGVKWLQNAVSQKDMEFLQGRAFNRDEIWNVLAPGLASLLSPNATEANSRTGGATFKDLTVYPMNVMMSEKITNSILTRYSGRPLVGHFEDVRVADKQVELQEMERYSESHTIEEIREKYYGDSPLGDDRDKLLPSQINAQSGDIQKQPEPKVAPMQQPPDMAQQEMQAAENKPPQEDTAQQEAQKAMLDDLLKYQRKAIKAVGKSVDFVSDVIPSDVLSRIHDRLPMCKSETAIKALFDAARESVKPKKRDAVGAIAVLDGLRATLEAMNSGRATA